MSDNFDVDQVDDQVETDVEETLEDDLQGTEGTADGLWRQSELIRQFAPDALVVVSADAVYRCDYAALVEAHTASGAGLTMVTTEVDPGDADRYVDVTDVVQTKMDAVWCHRSQNGEAA